MFVRLLGSGRFLVGGEAGVVFSILIMTTMLTTACQIIGHPPSTDLRDDSRVRRVVTDDKYVTYRATGPRLPFCTDLPITKGLIGRSTHLTCHSFSVAPVLRTLGGKRGIDRMSLTGMRGIVLSNAVPVTGCCLIR